MIADLHIHTQRSCDSKEYMEEYCRKAVLEGITCICFTDHVDYNINDEGYGYYDPEQYFRDFERVKKEYGERILLLSGIEFSEPHLYRQELERLSEYPYDFVIGSIHFVKDLFPDSEVRSRIPASEFFKSYWEEVLEAVSYGHFDCLGHMDFPKRFYGELFYDPDFMHKIFKAMLQNNIVPEINTSSLRKRLLTALPDMELLTIYKECGGRFVTVGSDAHSADCLADNNQYAKELISKAELKEVIYHNRRQLPVEI